MDPGGDHKNDAKCMVSVKHGVSTKCVVRGKCGGISVKHRDSVKCVGEV